MREQPLINVGIARLEVRCERGLSTVVDQFSQTPLQLHRPLYLDDAPFPTVYLKTPSSGLLGGDAHSIDVNVGVDSELELRTQAATLAYPGASSLDVNIRVKDGGKFVYLPHALILGAEAELTQTVRIDLEGSATILYSDSWCAGRIAMNEQWLFNYFDYSLKIFRDGQLAYRERWKIQPAQTRLNHALLCGDFTHFSSLFSFGQSPSEKVIKQSLPSPDWEIGQSWFMERSGGTISRRCSRVDQSKLKFAQTAPLTTC